MLFAENTDGFATRRIHRTNFELPSPRKMRLLNVRRRILEYVGAFCTKLSVFCPRFSGEFLFLLCGLYISSSARNAASHHGEKLWYGTS